VILAALALGVVACGEDEESPDRSSKQDQKIEKAFLTGMSHHHESAIEMAKIAQQRGQDPLIKRLGEEITTTQEREIGQMKSIYVRLFGGELKPDPGAHDGLGLTAEEAGMTHNERTNAVLRAADPFDKAFVDQMVPHHVGAIKMAKIVLESTSDPALKKLANTIIRTQEREVKEMNALSNRKYGGPVPKESGQGTDGEVPTGGEHDGH